MGAMQGLNILYYQTGHRAEWKRLVEEVLPNFVDLRTDGPLPGRAKEWSAVTEYRMRLAGNEHRWGEAQHLQQIVVEWDRNRAAPALAIPADSLDNTQLNDIRSLAASLQQLGTIQRELGQAECVKSYKESLELSKRIGEKRIAAICALNLGHTYKTLPGLRDLDQAECWYQQSLDFRDEHDRLGRAKCFGQLGAMALERFEEARAANKSKNILLGHLDQAQRRCRKALELLPLNAIADLAVVHGQLGTIYSADGQLKLARDQYDQAIQHFESIGEIYEAAKTRFNVAVDLSQSGRFDDALLYARAALRSYETYGDRAADRIQETESLIAKIEQAQNSRR